MGKIITFWSPYRGHGKVTSTLCAVVSSFAIQNPEFAIAISQSTASPMSLLGKLDHRMLLNAEKNIYETVGIGALKLYCRQKVLSGEIIRRCGLSLWLKNLFLYPNIGSEITEENFNFQLISDNLASEFHFVFVDLESGKGKQLTRYAEASDYLLIVTPQEPFYLENIGKTIEELPQNTDYGIIIGGYYEKSKFCKQFYKRTLDKRVGSKIIGVIPWNAGFFDAMAEGKTLDFFLRNQFTTKREENYEFILQAEKTATYIKKHILLSGGL